MGEGKINQREAPAGAPRIVIAHDFAETYGGAERTIAVAAGRFPDAPFHAILGRPSVAARMGVGDRFFSLLPPRERLLRHYRKLTPLYPALVRAHRLPEADLLLTSSYAFAHGFATENDAPQVCYCHSPLRFAWSMTDAYGGRLVPGGAGAAAFRGFAAWMRSLDRRAATRVNTYVASSAFVADLLWRAYAVQAEVIHPPVDCDAFVPGEPGHDGYFLLAGRLVEPYKRPGIAIEAFRGLGERLVIAGDGPALEDLRRAAPANVEFTGHVEQDELRRLMQRSAALVFPSRDDFGLAPVEAAACGRPTIAYGAGGALETVVPGVTGELFAAQNAGELREAVRRFDPDAYDPKAIRHHAEAFGAHKFADGIAEVVARTLAASRAPGGST